MCVPPVALTTLNSLQAHFWNLFVVATWHAWSQRARCTPQQPDIIPSCTEFHPPFDLAACRRRSRTARQGDLYHRFHSMTPRLRTLVPASSENGGSLTAGLPRKGRVVTEPVLCRAPDVSPFPRLSSHSAPGQRLSRASKVTFAKWCWRSCPSATAWRSMTYRRADARRARPTPCTQPLAGLFSAMTLFQTSAACFTGVPQGFRSRRVLGPWRKRESCCRPRYYCPHGLRWSRKAGSSSACCASLHRGPPAGRAWRWYDACVRPPTVVGARRGCCFFECLSVTSPCA